MNVEGVECSALLGRVRKLSRYETMGATAPSYWSDWRGTTELFRTAARCASLITVSVLVVRRDLVPDAARS